MSILKSTKKTIVSICLVLAIIVCQIGIMLFYQLRQSPAFAWSEVTKTIDGLSDPDFKKYSSNTSGKPYTPTNWKTAGGNEAGVSSGIICVENDTFNNSTNNKFGLTSNPGKITDNDGSTDDYILLINSNGQPTNYGYKSDANITLAANSYYLISVICKTDVIGNNGASIYLNADDIGQTQQYNFVNLNTQGSWETFNFYIQTNTYEKSNVTIELWLGSKGNITTNGQVYFDNIHVYQLSQAEYVGETKNYNFSNIDNMPTYVRNIDLKTVTLASSQFENSNFEAGLTGWEKTEGNGLDTSKSVNGVANIDNSSETLSNMGLSSTDTIPGNSNTANNKKALFINNKEASNVTYKSTSTVTIKQHGFYRLSLLLKTGNLTDGGANIRLEQVVEEGKTAQEGKLEAVTSSSGLTQYNGYQEHCLYICGSPFGDEQVRLYLSMNVAGYVIFDDITLQQITYSTYQSSGSSSTKLDLANLTDTTTVSNGAFNMSANKTADITYPLAVQNWSTENSLGGIINVNQTHYEANKANYGNGAINPGPVTNYPNTDQSVNSTNNVLMVNNTNPDGYAEFKSASFSLASNTTTTDIRGVEVWVKVQTNLSNANSGAFVRIETESGVVIAQTKAIRTFEQTINNDWQRVALYIQNSIDDISLHVVVGIGNRNNPTTGYAYFDNVKYLTTVTEDEAKLADGNMTVYTNLADDNFNSYIEDESTLNKPYGYVKDGEQDAATSAGVINLSTVDKNILTVDVPVREGGDNYMLLIKNNAPTHFTYKTSISRTFVSNNYYKVSVWTYTAGLVGENAQKYGANIKFTGVEDEFNNIDVSKVESEEADNGWVEYVFYIKCQSETKSTLYLSLGSEEYPTQGFVLFDTVSIKQITSSDYADAVVGTKGNVIKTTAETVNPEEEPEEEPTTTPSQQDVNLWYLIPSIIIAVALLIAVVGYAMRKIKFRPIRRRQKASSYDRDESLNADVVRRELAQQRRIKVKEIEDSISEMKKEIKEHQADYEKSLKEEKNKGKEERLFKAYARSRSKMQKQLENLEAAKTYILDENNIKLEEDREIRRRQYKLESENRKLVKNPVKEEEQVEEIEQKEESEAVKKARARAKMNRK